MSCNFTTVAPGRLCLFGEHQDYLNLPVISLAIPLHCQIEVTPDPSSRVLEIQVPQMDHQVFRYDLDNLPCRQTSLENADFALAALHEALDDGWELPFGATCVSTTNIVMQAGCSSSTAFTIAWVLVLAKLSGREHEVSDPISLAKLAHKAEVLHFGAPGGTMDHLSIAFGETCLRIGPDMWEVKKLNSLAPGDGVWILADSGEPKDTFGHLKRCKGDRLDLLAKIGGSWDASVEGRNLNSDDLKLLAATLTNRRTEKDAAELWVTANNSLVIGEKLGALMLEHHGALRDGLGLSTPKLEKVLCAAIGAGAWGYKLVGSGGGGCAVAWSPRDKADAVANAMEQEGGAKQTWVLDKPSQGARIKA